MTPTGRSNGAVHDDWAASMQAILVRMGAGERSALKALYDATSSRVYGQVLRIVPNRSDANEILCDVYREAWNRAVDYDPVRATVTGWLAVIAHSRAIDFRRFEARRCRWLTQSKDADINALGHANVEACHHPDVFVDYRAIRQALANLPSGSRDAISLAYLKGFTYSEIAQHKRLPLGTVKSLIRRGLNSLRLELTGTLKAIDTRA